MAEITKEIAVDVAKPSIFQTVIAKQYDHNSRFLKITITNGGVPLSIAPDSTIILSGKRNDGESKGFLGTVNNDGTVTVPLTGWLLEFNGIVECDITIVDNEGRKLSTVIFYLTVEAAIYDVSTIPEDENYDFLVELLGEISTAKENADKIILEARNAASFANEKALKAEEAAERVNDLKAVNVLCMDNKTNKQTNVQIAIDELNNNKVDKKDGKDLSTNDFTDEEKSKLAEILLGTLNIKEKNSSLGGLTIVHDGIYGDGAINITFSGGEIRTCTFAEIEVLRYLDLNTGNWVDVSEAIQGLNANMGDIETALDNIIAIQNSLIGGES